ncbi:MAG: hypothetical protein ACYTG5_09595 [Planctomycetota bacterium]|jgi:fermentation-respiration switch protein FrsA (DUF1100 family)
MSEQSSDPRPQKPGFFRRLFSWPVSLCKRMEPAARTKKGMAWGAALSLAVYGGFVGYFIRSGEGALIDIGLGAGVALLVLLIAILAVPLVRGLLYFLSHAFGLVGFAALLAMFFIFDFFSFSQDLAALSALIVMGTVFFGFGALAIWTSKDFSQAGGFKKTATYVAGLMAVVSLGGGIYLLGFERGDADHIVEPSLAEAAQPVAAITLPMDISAKGVFAVDAFTYGSGEDKRRPEFAEAVRIKTEPVNAKHFAKLSGWTKSLRERFWGFGVKKFPRNGRVWMPQGEGPFPLVLVVHGNHNMAEFSDPGYEYLGQHLGSHGYITVSVDENFLNGSFLGGVPKENDARGWMLLKHLELFREWNGGEGNPFSGKVDMQRIGLIGHSRGGEAVGHAAAFNKLAYYPDDAKVKFDFNFNIRSIIAIAPSDGQYKPATKYTPLENISYFVIHGAHDADVSRFVGDRQYERVTFTEPGPWFKSSLYVYRANHGQWNQVWGDTDTGPPRSWFLNRGALMPAEDQRKVAEMYFLGFFEATLRDRREYVDMFRDHRRIADRLPETFYVSRFEDPSFRLLTDFEEDIDITTTSLEGGSMSGENLALWKEADIPMRGGGSRMNNGVHLGWRPPEPEEDAADDEAAVVEASAQEQPIASYAITLPDELPEDWQLDASSKLVMQITTSKQKPPEPEKEEEENSEAEDAEAAGQNEAAENPEASENEAAEEESEDDEEEKEEDEPVVLLDLSLELESRGGVKVALPLSRFGNLPPVLKTKVTRLEQLESRYSTHEAVLQTFEIPLADFAAADANFDPSQLAAIRLRFDVSEKGVVMIDRIGFAK